MNTYIMLISLLLLTGSSQKIHACQAEKQKEKETHTKSKKEIEKNSAYFSPKNQLTGEAEIFIAQSRSF